MRAFPSVVITSTLEGGAGDSPDSPDSPSAGDEGNVNTLPPIMLLWPAVFDGGGSVIACSYIQDIYATTILDLFTAAGFVREEGFLANVDGVATVTPFLTSAVAPGAIPFGVVEQIDTMTKDGVTNLTRYLVRLSS